MILAQEDTGFEAGFKKALEEAALILPKVGYFLLILIVGIFVAKFVQKILTKVLQKVGFDQLVERGGIKKAMSKSKYDAAAILGRIVYYFIFLGVLSLAFSVFGADNPISQFIDRIVAFLPSLFVAVIALIIAFAVAAAVKDLLSNMLGGLSFGTVLANVASLFIIGIGVFFALGELGVATIIVGPLFVAILALFIVPPIIAFGVGGIEPAREAIRNLQSSAQSKAQEAKREVQSQQAQQSSSSDDSGSDAPATTPTRRPRTTTATPTTAAATTPAPVRRRRPTA